MTGGVEAVMGAQARLLAGAGHDVLVLAGRGQGLLLPELDSRHPEVERVTEELGRGGDGGLLFERLVERIGASLSRALAGRDLVIAHNVLTMPFNLPLAHALAGSGRRLLAWTHDLAWTNPRYRHFRRRRGPQRLLGAAQARTLYVAVSRQRQAEVCCSFGLPAGSVPIVPNGIDVGAFLGISATTAELACRAGFQGADPLLLAPTRVTRRKRLEVAIEAAARLQPAYPGLKLVVSGPLGPHSADNAAYAEELAGLVSRLGLQTVVCFLHAHPGPDGGHPVDDAVMGELYRLADVALLTSESEGFGLPVLEAGLLRLPLACPDLPVLRESGRGAMWTYSLGQGGAGAAAALARALRSRPARQRRRVVAEAAWAAVLERTERAIGTALAFG